MKFIVILFLSLAFLACHRSVPSSPELRYADAIKSLSTAKADDEKFYALDYVVKQAFDTKRYSEAKKYATELQEITPKFKNNWNYGNAVQDYNIILGRLAIQDGDIEKAKKYLLAAGETPGSPQLDSFGPNMTLANDLLAHGEKEVVVQYFNSCRGFWKMDQGRLDAWTNDVREGKTPNFGPNLFY